MNIAWSQLFLLDTPILEVIVRGTLVYWALFAMLRLVLRRQSSNLSVTDLLVVALIADAAQNAMAGDYHSISDGLLLVATIVFWAYFIDWLDYNFEVFRHISQPAAIQLVKNGKLLKKNMRRELITEDELLGQARLNGCQSIEEILEAFMEGDGEISVISKHDIDKRKRPSKPRS